MVSFHPTGMNDRNTYWAIRLFICRLYTTMESPCAFLIEYTTFKVIQRLLHFSFEIDKQSCLKDMIILHIECHRSSCITNIYELPWIWQDLDFLYDYINKFINNMKRIRVVISTTPAQIFVCGPFCSSWD